MRFGFVFLSLFLISLSSSAAITTGPIKGATVLAYKPTATIDTAGISRINLPVLAGETAGMASVGTKATVGRLLGAAGRGVLGPWGMAAITAAQLCYDKTDWSICHSTNDPLVPINIDKSLIVPAENTATISATQITPSTPNKFCYSSGQCVENSTPTDACAAFLSLKSPNAELQSIQSVSDASCYVRVLLNDSFQFLTVSFNPEYIPHYTCPSGYFLSDSLGNADSSGSFCTPTAPTCPSSDYILTNDLGGPLPVTGKFCTPTWAYSCPENYIRSDAYQNSSSDGMFCSYSAPYLTEQQKVDLLAPYLLNYYANQLFSDTDGKTLPDIFSDPDTTFDPTVTPADMPMTWSDLQKYTDWYISGKAQTTNPLAPYYISPSNYQYTQNYVNTTIQTNTNTNTNTNINSASSAQSNALTQEQYEASNKKYNDQQTESINSIDTSSMDNYRTQSGFDGNQGNLDSKITEVGNMASPVANPTLDLPEGGTCQQIPLEFVMPFTGETYKSVLPSDDWCFQLLKLKQAMAYFMYILTAVGIVYELIRRPVEGN